MLGKMGTGEPREKGVSLTKTKLHGMFQFYVPISQSGTTKVHSTEKDAKGFTSFAPLMGHPTRAAKQPWMDAPSKHCCGMVKKCHPWMPYCFFPSTLTMVKTDTSSFLLFCLCACVSVVLVSACETQPFGRFVCAVFLPSGTCDIEMHSKTCHPMHMHSRLLPWQNAFACT